MVLQEFHCSDRLMNKGFLFRFSSAGICIFCILFGSQSSGETVSGKLTNSTVGREE